MELKLPYINPDCFAKALIDDYGFVMQEAWDASRLVVPDNIGKGSLQLFIRKDIHFFRGKWAFNEQTIFHSDDPVGKMGVIDFRINSLGIIQSAAIEGLKSFEFDTTTVDGMRLFLPEYYFALNKTDLLKRFELYCLDPNIATLLKEVFQIDTTVISDSILLESKILAFIHYWLLYLKKENIETFFEGISSFQLHGVKIAKEIIDHSLDDTPTIKQLSKKTGLNECDLKRAFRIAIGLPIHQYTIKRRMEMARDLVLTTAIPLQEICIQLGYANRGHFSHLYKKFFGVNPLSHRMDMGNNN